MRLLPGVVRGACVPLAAVLVLAGCARFDAALGQRQAVVTFRPGATLSQKLAARSACARTPGVTAQALPAGQPSPYALPQVTFQVTRATDTDIARLETCLARFPAVAGVTLQDSGDEGS